MRMPLLLGCMFAALAVGVSPASAVGGNSANAKKCQKDGWKSYVRSDLRTTFTSEEDCVSYAAQGGRLVLIPKLPSHPLCSLGLRLLGRWRVYRPCDIRADRPRPRCAFQHVLRAVLTYRSRRRRAPRRPRRSARS